MDIVYDVIQEEVTDREVSLRLWGTDQCHR